VNAHAERMSYGIGLINATRAKAPDIEFLERHHIGLASGDHLGDPPWLCSSVCADTSVDVVSHDAQRRWPCALALVVEWIHRLLQSLVAHFGGSESSQFLRSSLSNSPREYPS